MGDRKKPTSKVKLLAPGSVFAMPLTNGQWSACRVLSPSSEPRMVIAEAASWIGDAPPTLAELTPFQPLVLSHHSWQGIIARLNVDQTPPTAFRAIGVQPLTPEEVPDACASFAGWEHFPTQVLLQWRWDHDRERLFAEDAQQAAAEARTREVSRATETKRLSALTLARVRSAKPFGSWKGHLKPAIVKKSRALLSTCVDGLVALGPKARKPAKLAVLKKCIEGFNKLDATNDHWITTIEREDICDAFQDVVAASGLTEDALADRWRDW